jgi:cystinosin
MGLTYPHSMACWSTSFYPQPIYNFRRGSTAGTSIDFPTVNCLGFIYYTIYNGAFLFSPVIRAQYASRHPLSEEPTVRLNDFAFAVHAVIMSLVVYSQFWPMIWGLQVSRFQRISKPIAGLFWGSVLAPLIAIWVVLARSPDGGHDPSTWAWIDVVSLIRKASLGPPCGNLTQEPSFSRSTYFPTSSSSSRL